MSLTGGKRKANKSLKAWVAFVKKVQKQEKLSYKDAIHRAKQRKDKGEKWMTGGQVGDDGEMVTIPLTTSPEETVDVNLGDSVVGEEMAAAPYGGKRRSRTMRRSRGRGKGRTARRTRGRASRRH
jgi:hypothetical protein